MKLQLQRQLQQFLRRASTTAAALKGKKPANLSAATSKSQAAVDISKMPQPLPVLTPLARSQSIVTDPIPSMETLLTTDKSVFCIELEGELQKRLPRTVSETSQHFGGNFFVLRKELIEETRVAMKESPIVVLDGPNGSGKSFLLMQIYASIRESFKSDSNRLTVYIPNVHKWTLGYFPYYPIEGTNSEFKQPELALEILRLIKICNPKKVPEGLAAEINEAQLDAYNRALPLYERIMKEFKEQGKEINLFMDGVNGLINEASLTCYMDQEGKALALKSLPLCANFLKSASVNIVGAMTHSNPSLPRVSPSFKTVNVPNYSQEELKRVLQLYSQLGHASTNKTDQFAAFKAFVSGSNGRKLYKSCEYDSIYYKH